MEWAFIDIHGIRGDYICRNWKWCKLVVFIFAVIGRFADEKADGWR